MKKRVYEMIYMGLHVHIDTHAMESNGLVHVGRNSARPHLYIIIPESILDLMIRDTELTFLLQQKSFILF